MVIIKYLEICIPSIHSDAYAELVLGEYLLSG